MIEKYIFVIIGVFVIILIVKFPIYTEMVLKPYTYTTTHRGRLCNQIIRNLCVSIIAEKHDLFVEYSNHNKICTLGIDLYLGKNDYSNNTILSNNMFSIFNIQKKLRVTDVNYFCILNMRNLNSNLNPNFSYFQTKEISNFLVKYLHQDKVKNKIIIKNPFKDRYDNNDDCFIHVRLGDAESYTPGLEYYLKALGLFKFNKLYISSDDINHQIIKNITKIHTVEILNYNEIQTIQFGSTCKNVVLSHGSFSAVIGYLSFFSNIYYKEYGEKNWHGDIFSIPFWNMVA